MIMLFYFAYFIILYFVLSKKEVFSREENLSKSKVQYYSLAILSFVSIYSFFIFKPSEYFYASLLQSVAFFILWIWVSYNYDNKFVLSIALLFLTIILTTIISPNEALNPLANNKILNISSIILGFVMIFISHDSRKKNFKKHFHLTYDSFALLLIVFTSILAIVLGDENEKYFYLLISVIAFFYFIYILFISKSILFALNIILIYYILFISFSKVDELKEKFESIKEINFPSI